LASIPQYAGRIVIIGGGFAGLSAAYELTRMGYKPVVLEAAADVGGLAASFNLGASASQPLECFYHHWFTNDVDALELCRELGLGDDLQYRQSNTGTWADGRIWRLSTPMDLLKFKPLGLIDRVRLGGLVLKARKVKDWRQLENTTAAAWLTDLAGPRVYHTVWEPLLVGKFGPYAEQVSAVWFWNKLCLRGSSRGKGGRETLVYPRGGFQALVSELAAAITRAGGEIRTGCPATGLEVRSRRVMGVRTAEGVIPADIVLATPALELIADLVAPHDATYAQSLRQIEYLAALCLVLELRKPLSGTYWLNVNDRDFPYVGIIEHTNFERVDTYGRHIVYLSKYLPADAELYHMPDADVLEHSLGHVARLMPDFSREAVQGYHVYRARYAQPVVVRNYSKLIPAAQSPLAGLYLASMAQIYPEDRGTSYAIREGRKAARAIVADSAATNPNA